MKEKLFCIGMLSIVSLFTGCSSNSSCKMVNQMIFDLNSVTEITIAYDEENISFYEGSNNELRIEEYMTADKKSYYAEVSEKKNSIHISEGSKPFFSGDFERYVKVYLPSEYNASLNVSTTNGEINFSDIFIQLESLYAESTSGKVIINEVNTSDIRLITTNGKIDCGNVASDKITVRSTNGNVHIQALEGKVSYTSTGGSLTVESARGGGSYKAENSGKLKVCYEELSDDLYMFNKNDSINLTLPENLSFEFKATTKNGSVSVPFNDEVSKKDRTTKGTIGSDPTVKMELESRNGNIKVEQ